MTVKNLITTLLEFPMESTVEVCTKDEEGNLRFADLMCVYTDDYNGKNTVVLTSE